MYVVQNGQSNRRSQGERLAPQRYHEVKETVWLLLEEVLSLSKVKFFKACSFSLPLICDGGAVSNEH